MRKYAVVAVLSLAFLLNLSCGKKNNDDDETPNGSGGDSIAFDSSVPQSQQKLFRADFNNAGQLSLSKPPADGYKKYFDIPDYSGPSWARWLNDRIKYVVGENWDWEQKTTASYVNSFNPVVVAHNSFEPLQEIVTLMENTGSYIYLKGKEQKIVYTVNVAGQSFQVRTNRVGIVRIGEGLFKSQNQISSKAPESLINSWLRIAVFVHEARHSDGNGSNAAFPHAVCTSGTYQGRSSCEDNVNGPYAIESVLLNSMYDSCTSCDSTERKALQLAAVDAKSRVQSSAKFRDTRPEILK